MSATTAGTCGRVASTVSAGTGRMGGDSTASVLLFAGRPLEDTLYPGEILVDVPPADAASDLLIENRLQGQWTEFGRNGVTIALL